MFETSSNTGAWCYCFIHVLHPCCVLSLIDVSGCSDVSSANTVILRFEDTGRGQTRGTDRVGKESAQYHLQCHREPSEEHYSL